MSTVKRAPVVGFSELYEIDLDGNVWRIKAGQGTRPHGRPLTANKHSAGYRTVVLTKDGKCYRKYLHRLMAEAFLERKEGQVQVNHKNGVKHDNRLENLEWVTTLENMHHAKMTGLNKGNTRKLTDDQVRLIRAAISNAQSSISFLARKFGVDESSVSKCAKGKTFRWLK